MRVAVASGKGGTGKTLFATHLAHELAERGRQILYADADVEEPNGGLLLHPKITESEAVTVPVPVMTQSSCSQCGFCVDACAFNAVLLGSTNVLFFHELCHGCGNCVRVCPEGVLEERRKEIGQIARGRAAKLHFLSGTLAVGEPRPVPLIDALMRRVRTAPEDAIIDCPPGSSCAVMAAVKDADLVLLVTEPTPFGWHDLRAALKMCFALGRPVAVILNRSNLGEIPLRESLQRWQVPVVGEMPFSRDLARANAAAILVTSPEDPFRALIGRLADALCGTELWEAARQALAHARAAASAVEADPFAGSLNGAHP